MCVCVFLKSLVSSFIQDVNIVATYSDHHGNIRLGSVKMGHLSSSWLFDNPLRPNTNPSSQVATTLPSH